MAYFLDFSDQVRFGLQEPDDADHGEETQDAFDFCPHCYAESQADHDRECPHFEEQPLPF